MATGTWDSVNDKLDLFLGKSWEADGTNLKSLPLRIEAWNWAQRVFVHHTPLQQYATLSFLAGGRSALLPEDYYAIDGIYDSTEERWWKPMRRRPGDIRYVDDEVLEYWVWADKIILENEYTVGATDLTLYYWAYYPDVTYNVETVGEDVLMTPRWAELALAHLTTANIMQPMEVFASDINQYKIRIESGNPEHNPRAQSALYHLNWYNMLLSLHPPANMERSG